MRRIGKLMTELPEKDRNALVALLLPALGIGEADEQGS
jgi:hypothetical protein